MKRIAILALVAAGCAGSLDGQGNPDAGGNSDAPPGCIATLSYDPPFPVAQTITPIRASVDVSSPGVLSYSWTVTYNSNAVTFTQEASDNSAIGFFAPNTGKYQVSVQIGGASAECSFASAMINVADPNANNGVVRLRTVPSPTLAPPQETVIQIQGGGDYNRDIALDSGLSVNATVTNGVGGAGIPAYVKLMPVAAPAAFTEVFASGTGTFSVRLLGQVHNVLVIPTSTTLAPKLLTWMPGITSFAVTGGTVVSGVVRDPAGTGLGGAKVQLMAGVVPSTIATTASNGTFSVRTDFPTSTPITVKVTPPAGSGLPRLEASGTLDLQQSLTIAYASGLQTCNLGGNAVKRGGANQANANVTFVGTLAGTSGTATTGAMTVNLIGTVRVPTTANGSGVLPTVLVPRSNALFAAVSLSAADWAVDTVDSSACAAQTIDAPVRINRTGITKNATALLGGVRIEATPINELAAADAQPVVATSDANGNFSIDLASGGTYDVRFIDPQARAAPLPVLSTTPANVPQIALLPKALTISGKVTVTGTSNPIIGASIQILCAACTGIDASRPIAQTATDAQSNYRIAVPDPGVM
jgi:hypothetical protein